jgi:hypothetical protein
MPENRRPAPPWATLSAQWEDEERAAQQHATPPGRPAGRARHAQESTQAQAAADARHQAAQRLAAQWLILEAQVHAQFPDAHAAAAVISEAVRVADQIRARRARGSGR